MGHTHGSLGLSPAPVPWGCDSSLSSIASGFYSYENWNCNKVMLFLNCLCRHHNRESGCLKSFENTPSIINEANISSVGELICMDHNWTFFFYQEENFKLSIYYVSLSKKELIVHTLRQPGDTKTY